MIAERWPLIERTEAYLLWSNNPPKHSKKFVHSFKLHLGDTIGSQFDRADDEDQADYRTDKILRDFMKVSSASGTHRPS